MAQRKKSVTGSQGPPRPHGGDIADRRAEFARRSRESGRDPEAERAFVQGKLDMVRSDPKLTEEEKQRALDELRRKLDPSR